MRGLGLSALIVIATMASGCAAALAEGGLAGGLELASTGGFGLAEAGLAAEGIATEGLAVGRAAGLASEAAVGRTAVVIAEAASQRGLLGVLEELAGSRVRAGIGPMGELTLNGRTLLELDSAMDLHLPGTHAIVGSIRGARLLSPDPSGNMIDVGEIVQRGSVGVGPTYADVARVSPNQYRVLVSSTPFRGTGVDAFIGDDLIIGAAVAGQTRRKRPVEASNPIREDAKSLRLRIDELLRIRR